MQANISTINISRVLRTVWLQKQISRVEIARGLELDKSTITKIVASLQEIGIIETLAHGEAGPQGGRRPIYLSIRKDFGCILGLEIQTESYSASVINLHGETLYTHAEPFLLAGKSFVSAFLEILRLENQRIQATGLPLIGIGIGASGIVNPYEGIIYQSNPLRIQEEVRVYDEVSNLLGVPVKLENDANCCCWGELAFANSERPENFLFVLGEFRRADPADPGYRGIAVGLGIVIGGTVHHGLEISAGEFKSILWKAGNTSQFSVTDEEAQLVESSPAVRERVMEELSRHIAFLVNTMNLSHVVIGGAIEKYKQELLPLLEREIQRNWSYLNAVSCTLRCSALGNFAVSYGAAALFLEHLFALPEVTERGSSRVLQGIDLLQSIQHMRVSVQGSVRPASS